ncbi:polyhydroxyalkanoate synthase [Fontimonas thermophila]|uniref:Polyhydroxyalkanoate synthase n=1 Tax=Fontimonas thermophila TaxID=1076937 RepID=A0A1I2JCR8_9GAMM|nr:alpha/beta fold hydrolase [Fontimonas thermophila]SFF52625.1 polyhydroxyalkanoate synthase [Fontimonas thermophila]
MIERIASFAAQAGDRAVQWVSNAVERRLRAENFIAANQTPYTEIHRNGLLSVRRYTPLQTDAILVGKRTLAVARHRHRIPVVLVPPLAANSLNFDLLPNRSLVKFLLAHGYAVYLVDWGDPDEDHSHLGLKDYTTVMLPEALAAVRADAGEPALTLLGYCMGGLFCLVYAGWSHDPKIRNIVTIASPIDAHQIGIAGKLASMMNAPLRVAARYVPFSLHDVDPKYLRVPGWVSSAVFKLTNPLGTVQSYVDLLMNLWDREFVTEYQTMATWFNRMHDYPGGIVQDFVVRVGLANELAKGEVRLGKDRSAPRALLDRIECSLLAIAGRTDRIVTIEAAKKVLDIVASEDKDFVVAPGGHAGVFAGREAPDTTWAFAQDWLSSRSD